MSEHTKQELEEAMASLASTLHKCEKMQEGGKLQSSQKTLNDRRVKALRLALKLMENEMGRADADGLPARNAKTYQYDAIIQPADKGGAYVPFPFDVRAEFGKGRVKVHAVFDGESYDGSIVNMGVKNADGSVCYIIGIRKDIRTKIGKQPGDSVSVAIRERE